MITIARQIGVKNPGMMAAAEVVAVKLPRIRISKPMKTFRRPRFLGLTREDGWNGKIPDLSLRRLLVRVAIRRPPLTAVADLISGETVGD
jgi:hypothetical protein